MITRAAAHRFHSFNSYTSKTLALRRSSVPGKCLIWLNLGITLAVVGDFSGVHFLSTVLKGRGQMHLSRLIGQAALSHTPLFKTVSQPFLYQQLAKSGVLFRGWTCTASLTIQKQEMDHRAGAYSGSDKACLVTAKAMRFLFGAPLRYITSLSDTHDWSATSQGPAVEHHYLRPRSPARIRYSFHTLKSLNMVRCLQLVIQTAITYVSHTAQPMETWAIQ